MCLALEQRERLGINADNDDIWEALRGQLWI